MLVRDGENSLERDARNRLFDSDRARFLLSRTSRSVRLHLTCERNVCHVMEWLRPFFDKIGFVASHPRKSTRGLNFYLAGGSGDALAEPRGCAVQEIGDRPGSGPGALGSTALRTGQESHPEPDQGVAILRVIRVIRQIETVVRKVEGDAASRLGLDIRQEWREVVDEVPLQVKVSEIDQLAQRSRIPNGIVADIRASRFR